MNMRVAARSLLAFATAMALAVVASAQSELTAAQIVEKNANARGGVEAWQKIQTMAWVGHVESAKAPGKNIPFLLEQQRPNRTRFEIAAENQKAIRAYDGRKGWKLRPGSNGIPELKPYTPDELSFARGAQAIDGPLMDDVAQGSVVTLGGVDEIGGHRAYALDVRIPSGAHHRIWVDAETFLEVKYEREYRNAQGQNAATVVYYRDYHAFDGLQMPVVIESSAATSAEVHKMVIERVALNPPLDEQLFEAPRVVVPRHHGVTVDTREPQSAEPIN
jgi:outer membrane lipoprotein-sorting protein